MFLYRKLQRNFLKDLSFGDQALETYILTTEILLTKWHSRLLIYHIFEDLFVKKLCFPQFSLIHLFNSIQHSSHRWVHKKESIYIQIR